MKDQIQIVETWDWVEHTDGTTRMCRCRTGRWCEIAHARAVIAERDQYIAALEAEKTDLERQLADSDADKASRITDLLVVRERIIERAELAESALARIAAALGLPAGAEPGEMVREAERIIFPLETTRDGRRITVGMELWYRHPKSGIIYPWPGVGYEPTSHYGPQGNVVWIYPTDCYSTREAAESAREAESAATAGHNVIGITSESAREAEGAMDNDISGIRLAVWTG